MALIFESLFKYVLTISANSGFYRKFKHMPISIIHLLSRTPDLLHQCPKVTYAELAASLEPIELPISV